jgi:hypothetical protein
VAERALGSRVERAAFDKYGEDERVAKTTRSVVERGRTVEICVKHKDRVLVEPYGTIVVGEGISFKDSPVTEKEGLNAVLVVRGPATISLVEH